MPLLDCTKRGAKINLIDKSSRTKWEFADAVEHDETTLGRSLRRLADDLPPDDAEIATFAALMAALGYDRYVAQGGDWGSAITTAIGGTDVEHCAAVHVTLAMGARPKLDGEPTPEEQRALDGLAYYAEWDSGYSKQQSTRPQSVGYGLVDSPAAQAAWILEKFWAWTDCDGHPENVLACHKLGYDIFDSAMPTRDARHGRLFTFKKSPESADYGLTGDWFGYKYINDEAHIRADLPISEYCDCPCCSQYPIGYLHHLFKQGDTLFMRLATLHNLRFMALLCERIQKKVG